MPKVESDSEKVLSVPLGKRLESLDSDDEQDIMQEMADTKIQKQLPKTGSLEVLLSQYLETGDYLQIENVLNVDDKKVIQSTIQRIETKNVLPLLNVLVMKLEANSRRGKTLLVWIRFVLQYHSSYLMSVPELRKKLSFLRRLLDLRSSCYRRLMKLRGRLDLVLSHARSVTRDDIDFSQAQIPLLEVDEGAIEEEESEEEGEEEEVEVEEENSDDIDSDLNDSYDSYDEDGDEDEAGEEDEDEDEDDLEGLLE